MNDTPSEKSDRREFIKCASCVIGGAIGLVPMAAGVYVAMDPLRHSGDGTAKTNDGFMRLATLEDLPLGGAPMKYSIVADKADKWSRYKDMPIGAVYLQRTTEKQVVAFNTVCPHLGCFVDYRKEEKDFFCPCHNSNFSQTGALKTGVSPRGMDSLEVELRNDREVWVKFQHFKANTTEKTPVNS
ncbi:MAG: Rieske (2Fe-2S) protein [Pedosphaera sp.]|nr:Rieske (2Fe-2S) protein [Pedosphaera sp.]MSU42935.1 Rieske (2Fe-2S) protein [Pedosphaera sp.]